MYREIVEDVTKNEIDEKNKNRNNMLECIKGIGKHKKVQ